MAEDNPPTEEASGGDDAPGEDFRYIVRIANTDLDGKKQVRLALTGIKGVGERVAGIVSETAGVDTKARIGDLDDAAIDKLGQAVQALDETLPTWMRNRRNDIQTGENIHLLTSDLNEMRRADLNRLRKIRSYRGVRHETGHKVRGQRTRANGRSGLAMGVSRTKE